MKYESHDIVAVGIGLMLVGCTVTMISVRKSDNTTISTDASKDSTNFDLGDWNMDLNRSGNDSIKVVDTVK